MVFQCLKGFGWMYCMTATHFPGRDKGGDGDKEESRCVYPPPPPPLPTLRWAFSCFITHNQDGSIRGLYLIRAPWTTAHRSRRVRLQYHTIALVSLYEEYKLLQLNVNGSQQWIIQEFRLKYWLNSGQILTQTHTYTLALVPGYKLHLQYTVHYMVPHWQSVSCQ